MTDEEDRMDFPSDLQGRTSAGGPALWASVVPGVRLRSDAVTRCRTLGIPMDALLLAAGALTLGRWTGRRRVPVRCGERTVEVRIVEEERTDKLLETVARALRAPGGPIEAAQVAFGPKAEPVDGIQVALRAHWCADDWDTSAGAAADVWTQEELCAFADDLLTTTAELAGSSRPVEDVRGISTARRALLTQTDRTGRDFPAESLDALFHRTAQQLPDAVAVREGGTRLTYRQLDAAASLQARLLAEAGVGPGDTVLIGLPRSSAEVVAVLGTVRAGAAYVGVDLGSPPAHLERITATCRPAAVLCDSGGRSRLPAGVPAAPVWDASLQPDTPEAAVPPSEDGGDRPAYVAFTSGSTGAPKGVCVPHRAVVRLVHGADYAALGPRARMLRLSPLAFDASTLELWGALLTGATMEVYDDPLPSPTELGEFLVARGVTVAWLTAGLFRLLVEFAAESPAGLRQVLSGGDVVPHEHVARLLERHPGLVITNGYGPTENTTFTTTHTVTRPQDVDGPLPIGTPVPGTGVHVLDDRARLVPPGAVGELYVSGEGLATGYLGDPEETARRFGCFSPDVPERLYRTGDLVRVDGAGRLCFLGRADDQVKLRGFRVEPAAVGATLAGMPPVQDALVFAVGADSASKRLVAAVVPAEGETADPTELRSALADRLPPYMVPALWTVVDRLPLTRNGKVDRRRLAEAAAPVR